MTTDSARIAQAMDELLDRTAGTICPSDVARALGDGGTWRDLMDDVRAVAFRRADAGEVEITQGGQVVDGRSAKGPIRIRRAVVG